MFAIDSLVNLAKIWHCCYTAAADAGYHAEEDSVIFEVGPL